MYASSGGGGGSGGFVIPTSNSRPGSPQQPTAEELYTSNGGHGYKRPAAGYGMDEQAGKRMRMSDTPDGAAGFTSGARHPSSLEAEDIIAGIRGAISAGSNTGVGGYAPMGYSTTNVGGSQQQGGGGMYFSHPLNMPHQHQHHQQHRTTHSQTPHLASDQNNPASPGEEDGASDSEGSDAEGEESSSAFPSSSHAHHQHGGALVTGGQGYVRFTAGSEAPGGGAEGSMAGDNDDERKRPKMTRGSRRLKMKCVEADIENGIPCKRCRAGNLNCVFEESLRGKKSNRGKKSEAMAKSLKKMEETLHSVLRSIHNPEMARLAGNLPGGEGGEVVPSFSPSMGGMNMDPSLTGGGGAHGEPSRQQPMYTPTLTSANPVQAAPSSMSQPPMTALEFAKLLRKSNNILSPADISGSTAYSPGQASATGSILSSGPACAPLPEQGNTKTPLTLSPRLQSLPDNAINPLGLLAEASLQNSHRKKSFSGPRGAGMSDIRSSMGPGASREAGAGRVGSTAGARGPAGGPSMAEDREERALDDEDDESGGGGGRRWRPREGLRLAWQGMHRGLVFRMKGISGRLKPEILTFITPDEVHDLFDIFYSRIHPQVPVLSKVLHTPSSVCSRSPFLLTTVCAIASRYYDKKRDLYPRLAAVARRLVWEMSAKGFKSVEAIQGFLLQACYTLSPTERWEQDQSYMLLGMAVRMGLDLNLYRKNEHGKVFTDEDRTRAYEMGKPCTAVTDVVIQSAQSPMWYQGPYSQPEDIQLAGYLQLQRIIYRALQIINPPSQAQNGLAPSLDYNAVLRIFQEELDGWERWCTAPYDEITTPVGGASRGTVEFYYRYNSLLLASFGLENALQRNPIDIPTFFHKVYESAWAISEITIHALAATQEISYFTDSQNVFLSYAMLSLLKLLKPEFRKYISDPQKILDRVNDVIDVMNEASRDPQHSPGLYAVLLRSIVNSKREDMKSEPKTDTTRSQNLVFSMHPSSNGVVNPQQLLADPANPNIVANGNGGNQNVTIDLMVDGDDNGMYRRMTTFVTDPAKPNVQTSNPQHSASAGPTLAAQHEASVPSTPAGAFSNGPSYAQPDGKGNGSHWNRGNSTVPSLNTSIDAVPTEFNSMAATPVTSRPTAGHHNLLNGLWNQMNHGYSEGSGEMPQQQMQQMQQTQQQQYDLNNMFGIQDLHWDSSLLLPGFDGFGNLELSGGLIHTRFGSGFISPSFTPMASRQGSPRQSSAALQTPHPNSNLPQPPGAQQ
ncbi:hypothetical protein QFC21_006710 [Naganishia friedmannii]|uniref:Uncharacterized protein n=1 Tax=Naganishia friedmannii TaxID=89922 RepID=A0ACC2V0W2_9TREE|nr:hypothetical protein QFC21_006710 [Naganishia friedmannii]